MQNKTKTLKATTPISIKISCVEMRGSNDPDSLPILIIADDGYHLRLPTLEERENFNKHYGGTKCLNLKKYWN